MSSIIWVSFIRSLLAVTTRVHRLNVANSLRGEWFWATSIASVSVRLWDFMSFCTVLSYVMQGRPGGLETSLCAVIVLFALLDSLDVIIVQLLKIGVCISSDRFFSFGGNSGCKYDCMDNDAVDSAEQRCALRSSRSWICEDKRLARIQLLQHFKKLGNLWSRICIMHVRIWQF